MADRIITEQSPYAGRPAAENVMRALEMAIEISNDSSRNCSLAFAIGDGLEDNESAIGEFHLAEVLSRRLTDCAQSNRLIECLRTLAAQLGVEDAETAFTS